MMPINEEKLEVCISLLINTSPLLDLMISEHNDGVRLQRDILMFLAGCGYTEYLKVRK